MTSVFALIVALACALAALLEIACMREPSIPDNALSLVGRRILVAGLLLLFVRLTWLVGMGEAEHVNPIGMLGIGFVALANVIRCANRLAMLIDVKLEQAISHGAGSARSEKS